MKSNLDLPSLGAHSLNLKKRFITTIIIVVQVWIVVYAQETATVFQNLPNSGVSMEGLYANPAHGAVCIEDFNEDGFPDILITGPNYNEATQFYTSLLLNDKTGHFSRHELAVTPVAFGDIKAYSIGSKKWIVAVQGCTTIDASTESAVAYTFTLNCSSTPRASSKKDLANGAYNGQLQLLDFNRDGNIDIVQYGEGRKLYAYTNDGKNNFTATDASALGLKGFNKGDTKIADINGDGLMDIVSASTSGLFIYYCNADGTFTSSRISTKVQWGGIPRLELADLDKDGQLDIIASSQNNTTQRCYVSVFWGDGESYIEDTDARFFGVEQAAIAIGDFNKDGNLDIAFSGINNKVWDADTQTVSSQKAYIMLGDGKRGFSQNVKWDYDKNAPDVFTLGAVREGRYYSADFDGDGYADILALGYLGKWTGGKNMRYADLYYSGTPYGWGEPLKEFAVKHQWEGFPLEQVRLKDSRLKQAMDKEIAYLKSLDINRLYASTLDYNLGIRGNTPYGGWEESGYGSSFAHWTSGLALGYAATGDEELLTLLKKSIDIMVKSQAFNGDGFFAFKDGTTWGFDKMAKYKIIEPYGWDENGHPWGNNDIGFPLYAHHKILAAMRDAYVFGHLEEARIGFLKFCDWFCMWVQNFDEENMQKILESEHGGMVEVLSDAYALSGNTKYLDCAETFARKNFISKMSANSDDLAGRHSNFHVPMAVGSAVNYHYTGNDTHRKVGHNFFNMVKDHHSLANGSHGNQERFGLPDNQTYQMGMRGPETCSSYNMLKLAKEEFMQEGNLEYMDFFENVMLNHILASFPLTEGEGPAYYMSLKPGTFKCYDDLYNCFWCCTGTTMEVQMKYGDAIFFHNDNDLLVNLYTPSTLNWEEKGLKLSVDTKYPVDEEIKITIEDCGSFTGDLCFRYPKWQTAGMTVLVNGAVQSFAAAPGEVVRINGSWKAGDVVSVKMPPAFRLVDMPDDVNVSAVFYGPLMMGSPLGSIEQKYVGISSPDKDITPTPGPYFPAIKHSRSNLETLFNVRDKDNLKFRTKGLTTNYTLQPFCDIHDQRYNVYWQLADDEDMAFVRTVVTDQVILGDDASEKAHNMKCSNSNSGYAAFGFWGPTYFYYRDAKDGGYVQFDLDLAEGENTVSDKYYLQLVYFGSEPQGFGNFKIYVDGAVAATVGSIAYLAPLDHKPVYYPIPSSMTKGKNRITVKFADGRISMYALRLLKARTMSDAREKLQKAEEAASITTPTAKNTEDSQQGIYNLLGQRLSSPAKGINIVNGHKEIIR